MPASGRHGWQAGPARRQHHALRAGGDHPPGLHYKHVREGRHDLLEVMGYEHQRRRAGPPRESIEEMQEMLARHGIESGARLVEDQQPRPGHERAAHEDALALPLRQQHPLAAGERRSADRAQDGLRAPAVGAADRAPKVELRVLAADDGLERRLGRRDQVVHGRGYEPEMRAQLAPVGPAKTAAEQVDRAAGRCHVGGQRLEQRGLAAAVRSEDRPVLSALHAPRHVVQDDAAAAFDAQVRDIEDRRGGAAGGHGA